MANASGAAAAAIRSDSLRPQITQIYADLGMLDSGLFILLLLLLLVIDSELDSALAP
jgi:hypothetical protein